MKPAPRDPCVAAIEAERRRVGPAVWLAMHGGHVERDDFARCGHCDAELVDAPAVHLCTVGPEQAAPARRSA